MEFSKHEIQGIGTLKWAVTSTGKQVVLQLDDFDCEVKKRVMRLARSKRHYRQAHSSWEKPDGTVHIALYETHTKPIGIVVRYMIQEVVKTIRITYREIASRKVRRQKSKGYVNHRTTRRKIRATDLQRATA